MKACEKTDPKLENLLEYLRDARGFDFTGYKRASLMRRIRRRMNEVDIESFEEYQDYLEIRSEEFARLFDTILINITSFFRDREAWTYLAEEIIPRILECKGEHDLIRVWCAACSSGEEAYTLAMLFAEKIGEDSLSRRVKIYATDADEDALAKGRHACYSTAEMENVPEELREKYFEPNGSRYCFRRDLRRTVIFGNHDLVRDAPISRLDLLICRNTLMYLNAELQSRILAHFHFALNDNGFLMLGKAEMLLTRGDLFVPVELKHRVFQTAKRPSNRDRLFMMTSFRENATPNQDPPEVRLPQTALEASPLPQIAVDRNGNLRLINRKARETFDLKEQDLDRPLRDIEISYRPTDLRSLIDRASSEREEVVQENVAHVVKGEKQIFNVFVTALAQPGDRDLGALVTFLDVTRVQEMKEDLARTKQELETANEELQSSNEELETTNEELQSAVEELQTTNEELQSSNEEMETMNAELQATNEELTTTNEEIRAKTEESKQLNHFYQSMLDSLRECVIVVDNSLKIRLWNARARDLWGLDANEVIGESLGKLDSGLPADRVENWVKAFLRGEETFRELTLDAVTRRGKTIQCSIKCTMRLGGDRDSQGVVLTMDEVSEKDD